MRVMSEWPWKRMPNRSKTSRSCQLAVGQTREAVGGCSPSAASIFRLRRCRVAIENRWYTTRSEEHTSELQSPCNLVCRLLLEKKKKKNNNLTSKKILQLQSLDAAYKS